MAAINKTRATTPVGTTRPQTDVIHGEEPEIPLNRLEYLPFSSIQDIIDAPRSGFPIEMIAESLMWKPAVRV